MCEKPWFERAAAGKSAARPEAETVSVMTSKKVLIVEDNELNMKLFHDLLDAQGYETLQTREGLAGARAGARSTGPT